MLKTKKILALILCFTVFLSLLPGAALAVTESSANFTADALGLGAYGTGTATIDGIAVEWIELGSYGNGIQMRVKNGNASTLWNTAATSGGITKIEFTYSATKNPHDGNNMIVNFGNEAKGADCAKTLVTVADQKTYTITPDSAEYTFFYLQWDSSYSAYWDSIKVYYNGIGAEPEPEPEPEKVVVDISTALEAESGEFTVKGAVTLIDGKNLYLQDDTGAICVRMSANPTIVALGDTVIATGSKTVYNGLPQLGSGTYEISEGMTLSAKETTIDALTTADICSYVKLTGLTVTEVFDNDGAYTTPNITVTDGTNEIQIYKAVVDQIDGAWAIQVGDTINVTAAVSVFKETLQLRNTLASEITKVEAPTEGTIGDLSWALSEDGVLTITGNGDMPDWDYEITPPWIDHIDSITSVVIEDGITSIGSYAFTGCCYLTDVTIPDNVTYIGVCSFAACSLLTNVIIPDSVIYIDSAAFHNTGLTDITIPGNVTYIGAWAFDSCSSLRTIVFTGPVPGFGEAAFENVTATAFYPCDDDTWTEDVFFSYGGELTWLANHDIPTYTVEEAATCTTNTIISGLCEICGENASTQLPNTATGHSFGSYEVYIEAACNQDAILAAQCLSCGEFDTVTDFGTALAHNMNPDGVCTLCGASGDFVLDLYDSYGDSWDTGALDILADGEWLATVTLLEGDYQQVFVSYFPDKVYTFHWVASEYSGECSFNISLYGELLLQATQTDCIYYGDGETVFALCSHTPEIETFEPTCSEMGYTLTCCTVCEWDYSSKLVDTLEHDFETVTTEPTCTEDGYTTYTCTVCGFSFNEDFVLANHTFGDYSPYTDATCTQDATLAAKCEICGWLDVIAEPDTALGHSYDDDGICATCGATGDFVLDLYDYFEDGWDGSALEIYADGELFGTVTMLGGAYQQVLVGYNPNKVYTFQWVASEYSDECSFEIYLNEQLLHSASSLDCYVYEDGETVFALCSHTPESETVAPTCTGLGYTVTYCTVCEWEYCGSFEGYLDHSFGEYLPCDDATCTQDATEAAECEVCGLVNKIVIPDTALGHSYGQDGACEVCGAVKDFVLDLYDNYGDGWNGNALEVYADGELVATVTLFSGEYQQVLVGYDPNKSYTFQWVAGEYADECSFEIYLEALLLCGADWYDCQGFEDGHVVYVTDAPCNHEYEAVVTDPTCTEDGYTTYTCTLCGHSYEDDFVIADHNYEAVVTDPTCTEDGYTTYTCASCGDSYVDDAVDATGHDYEAVVTAPTCTEGGYTTYTCASCGDSYLDDAVDATGHDYEAVVTAPTCTEDGYTTYTCASCGDSYVGDDVAATGHDYEAVVTAPTCTEDGYTTYTCAGCGHSYMDDTIAATGEHDYSKKVTYPTLTANGYTTFTCKVCGYSYVEAYTFPDVPNTLWSYKSIEFAVAKGYFSGYKESGTFGPTNNITRQDFVVVLARIAKVDLSKYSGRTGFPDVKAGDYYEAAVKWASSTGVVSGYKNGNFGVNDEITREQLVTILYRYAQKMGYDTTVSANASAKLYKFGDAGKVTSYAKTAMIWALDKGIINGMTATTVGPLNNASRGQVATILMNISNKGIMPW